MVNALRNTYAHLPPSWKSVKAMLSRPISNGSTDFTCVAQKVSSLFIASHNHLTLQGDYC